MGTPLSGRRLPIGAEPIEGAGVEFRVWAPRRRKVELVVEAGSSGVTRRSIPLRPEGDGHFSCTVPPAQAGILYRYRLDGEDHLYPDPASRFQPEGPHGPSQVVDPSAFEWTDDAWRGVRLEGQVIYELHLGTFTPEGTLRAAEGHLRELASLGITLVELMPVAEFPGRFGWGYDGVDLFAPSHLYGTPDDLRRFVDRAHAEGLGVILDVVYNHLGPDGNYLPAFSRDYFTSRYANEWGDAINFDGENSGPVREFFIANAGYWIDEFHMDGLRLDATQQMYDSSADHVLAAISRHAREVAGKRSILLVAENELEQIRLVKPIEEGGYGLDALWNDDYHHSVRVAMTGHNEAYLSEYLGTPQELISAVKHGYLSQGQRYYWQGRRRGSATRGLRPATFVVFIQNHDQIANSAFGRRCHRLTSPGLYRALTALTLLSPGTPMLFQGQEFASSAPFLYFADHRPDLAKKVARGRAEFLSQFPSIATPEVQARLPEPSDPETFTRCKLDFSEREKHSEAYELHRDLLRLRREDPVLRSQGAHGIDGAVLTDSAFVIRLFGEGGDDRLLLVNLGRDLNLAPAQEPLLAPPDGGTEETEMEPFGVRRVRQARDRAEGGEEGGEAAGRGEGTARVAPHRPGWEILWSSEDPRYGGLGTPEVETETCWRIRGQALVVLKPVGSHLWHPSFARSR